MCSVLTIKLLMKKKIEKVINKEIKKKKGRRGVLLQQKKIKQTCGWLGELLNLIFSLSRKGSAMIQTF